MVRSILILACLISSLNVAGCAKRTYQLPADWPISQLTLPANSTIVVEPFSMHKVDPNWPDQDWTVQFDCPSNMQAVVDHVEQCIKPLQFSEYYAINPSVGSSRSMFREYFTPDGLSRVLVEPGTNNVKSMQQFSSDYMLHITISTSPYVMLKYAGTTSSIGVKHVLEPIK